jgi:hypothetical protein
MLRDAAVLAWTVPVHLCVGAGFLILCGALPWFTLGCLLGVEEWGFYKLGVLGAFWLVGVVEVGRAAGRAMEEGGLKASKRRQAALLFQCMARLMPWASRGASARLTEWGDELGLEVALRGNVSCRLKADPTAGAVWVTVRRGERRRLWGGRVEVGGGEIEAAEQVARCVARALAQQKGFAPSSEVRAVRLSLQHATHGEEGGNGAAQARFLSRELAVLARPRLALTRRVGWLRVGVFWGAALAGIAGMLAWMAPWGGATLGPRGGGWGGLYGGGLGLLMLGLVWVKQPQMPKLRARRVLQASARKVKRQGLRLQGRWLRAQGWGEVDVESPLRLVLTRGMDASFGHVLGVCVWQGGKIGLKFQVPAQPNEVLVGLPSLELDAPLLEPEAFGAWVWPLLRARAEAFGQVVSLGCERAAVGVSEGAGVGGARRSE